MSEFPLADPSFLMTVAQDLVLKGWQPVWCILRRNGKFTPEDNPMCTGSAPYPTVTPQPSGAHRLGFRMPPDIVLIDVDHYEDKHGADTLDLIEERLGDLPATYKVTSRGVDHPSGRFLYRIPADLVINNGSFGEFANELGHTDIDILRTGHRFSWAPGDIHHKNGLTVRCYDTAGESCSLPDVTDPEIPWLPPNYVEYLRNPPRGNGLSAYTRPGDGPQWWLAQPDNTIGSDDELKSFAWNMMLARVDIEEIYAQWQRVARADDPSRPWERYDFDRHTRAAAQFKAAQQIAREEAVLDSLPATREQLAVKEEEAKLESLRDQRIQELIDSQQHVFPVQPLDQDTPQAATQTMREYLEGLTRGYPEFREVMKRALMRDLAAKDISYLLSAQFEGYKDISQLPEPDAPETLVVVGKGTERSAVVSPRTVTVISGHRSSGKTWVTALWAAQEMRAGNTVFWMDFERQDRLLASKLRQLGITQHIMANQLKYTSELPASADLTNDVKLASEGGLHRVLVVVDAWRTLQNLVVPDGNTNDGDAIERVYIEYLNPIVKQGGATVVLLDHMAKSATMSTIGAERKESAADYVLNVTKTVPFSHKTAGYATLTMTKVRAGTEDEGTPMGYLWMPGTGDESGPSIKDYPSCPELRNWAPEDALTLDAVAGTSEKAQREAAILSIVRDNRLQLGPRPLGTRVYEVYPDLFSSAKGATDLAARMRTDGKLSKEEGKDGKYDIPDIQAPVEVNSPASSIDPGMLRHDEEL